MSINSAIPKRGPQEAGKSCDNGLFPLIGATGDVTNCLAISISRFSRGTGHDHGCDRGNPSRPRDDAALSIFGLISVNSQVSEFAMRPSRCEEMWSRK